ncbi:hypothetical protein ACWC09_17975 [Streptomyces sp. NPDC001617]
MFPPDETSGAFGLLRMACCAAVHPAVGLGARPTAARAVTRASTP